MDEAGERTLRAKYLDWCSARVAEQFLDLSAEEIWALSRPAEASSGGEGGREAGEGGAAGAEASRRPPSSSDEGSYRRLVQRATEALLARMSLPPFEEWRRAYEASPARYDAEMLGFWREASEGGGGGRGGG